MKLIRKNKKGFTLVELIVVIAILAILALILVPAITGYIEEANKSKNQANARALYSQAVLEASTWDSEDTISEGGIAKLLDADGGTVTVTLDENKVVTSVTYTPEGGGDSVTWPEQKEKNEG